jgi:hypothetical protein
LKLSGAAAAAAAERAAAAAAAAVEQQLVGPGGATNAAGGSGRAGIGHSGGDQQAATMAAAAASTAAAATAAATAVAEALKPQKFIHALALVPASSMSIEQLGQLPEVRAVTFHQMCDCWAARQNVPSRAAVKWTQAFVTPMTSMHAVLAFLLAARVVAVQLRAPSTVLCVGLRASLLSPHVHVNGSCLGVACGSACCCKPLARSPPRLHDPSVFAVLLQGCGKYPYEQQQAVGQKRGTGATYDHVSTGEVGRG